MATDLPTLRSHEHGLTERVALTVLTTVWAVVRFPVLAILVILEPVVRVLLAGVALLVTLNALFLAALRPLSVFPFWSMLGFAVGCVALLAVYYTALRLLSA